MQQKSPRIISHDDSIWDVENKCYVMSNKSITAFAQLCLDNDDVSGMEALLIELGGVQYNENCTQRIVDLVLSQDAVSIANIFFSKQDMQDWSDDNKERLLAQCPKLFAQWSAPVARRVRGIAGFFSKGDDFEKCNILEGRNLLLPAKALHTLLKQDVSLWQELSVSWIGEKGSVLRATASAAGWAPEMLPNMLRGRWISRVENWGNVFDYPCGLCLANDAAAVLDYKERRATGGAVFNHPGRMVGKSMFMALPLIKFSSDSDPVDVALAEIITQRVRMGYILEKTPDVVEVSLDVRERLTHVVDMHLSLGCLNLLVDALSRDTLPGVQDNIKSKIELPELNAPTY